MSAFPRALRLRGSLGLALFGALLLAAFVAPPARSQSPAPPALGIPAPTAPAPAEEPPAPPPGEAGRSATDATTGEIRDIEARAVIRLRGQSTWDDGFSELKKAIAMLEAEGRRLALAPAGQPMAHFVDSDDLGFTYEAMLPLAAPAPPGTPFSQGFDGTNSPAGKAIIFPHEGAYDEIDTAYEAITAYLDAKNLVSTGTFLEEYAFIPEKSDDPGMKLKIVVFLR